MPFSVHLKVFKIFVESFGLVLYSLFTIDLSIVIYALKFSPNTVRIALCSPKEFTSTQKHGYVWLSFHSQYFHDF